MSMTEQEMAQALERAQARALEQQQRARRMLAAVEAPLLAAPQPQQTLEGRIGREV